METMFLFFARQRPTPARVPQEINFLRRYLFNAFTVASDAFATSLQQVFALILVHQREN